jgi:hypothetical protein
MTSLRLALLRHVKDLVNTGWPVLMALSNKDFIGETLGVELTERLEGTLAANALAAADGARMFRVHEVGPTRRVLEMVASITRNLAYILKTVKELTDEGVTLVSITDGIDSSTAAGRMMIGVLGSLAAYERELIQERSALKRAASRANGTKFGRPRKVNDTDHIATAKRMKADGHTGKDIAKFLGVSRATLYRYLDEDSAA